MTPAGCTVDLCLPVRGKVLPADHGYELLSALSHWVPTIHDNPRIGILTITGIGDGRGQILLTPSSHLRIRLPLEEIPTVYKLAGKCLRIGTYQVQLGIPRILPIKASSILKARLVTIKGYLEAESFERAAQSQLSKLGIQGHLEVMRDRQGNPLRKALKIKCHNVVGFTTIVRGLTDDDSIRLQEIGLGGRRRMGCGFFLPWREANIYD